MKILLFPGLNKLINKYKYLAIQLDSPICPGYEIIYS